MTANYSLLFQGLPQMTPYPQAAGALQGLQQAQQMGLQQDQLALQQQQNAMQGQMQQAQIEKLKQEMGMDKLKMIPSLFGNINDATSYQQALMMAQKAGLDVSDMPSTWTPEAQAFTQRASQLAQTALQQNATADMKEAAAMGMSLQDYYNFKNKNDLSKYDAQKDTYVNSEVDKASLQKLSETSQTAQQLSYKLDNIDKFLDNVKTGKFADAKLLANQIGGALGNKDLRFEAGNAESLQALARQAQLDVQTLLKGSTSNRDMETIAQSAPELTKTPEGNKQLIAAMKAAAQRSTLQYDFTYAYRNKFHTTEGANAAFDKMIAENPLMMRDDKGSYQFNSSAKDLTSKFGQYLDKPDYNSPVSNQTSAQSNASMSSGGFMAPNGLEISDEQLKARAAKEGISEDQLISKYGLKKKALKTAREVILR